MYKENQNQSASAHSHSGEGAEASSQESCPLCARPKYCFLIKDNSGETVKVLCQWTDPHTPPEGWQHVGAASDGRPVFTLQGYQRKRRGKKYPKLIELKPQARTDIPQWQDVKIPVEQAERGHTVRIKPGNPGASDTLYELKEIKAGKPGRGLLAVLTVKDSPYGGKLELPLSEVAEVVTYDPETGAKEQFVEYFYSDELKVIRYQWTDRRAVYNGKTKEIRPYHRATDGRWIKGKGDRPWPLYRQSEAEATIRSGGIVFAAGGEQTVEYLRSLGLTGVCNQGGEGGYRQIAKDLAPTFQLVTQLIEVDAEIDAETGEKGATWSKPLLVTWPDNDETGRKTFGEGLLKECYKNGVTSVAIAPLLLWPDMPDGGDANDWIDHCREAGISESEMIRKLEFTIDAAIDLQEEEIHNRWQREAWKAPVSNKGEIGRWVEVKNGQDSRKEWQPLANFDFQVERELEDPTGGGLVLQVKRCFERRQYRAILNSTDYTAVDKFVDALKAAMGTGVVCNLTKHELGALMHTRLHEYRTNRQGKVYKRIDCYGQQADGVWVFQDRQFTKDGQPVSEDQTGWVFSDVSAEGDEIPCPEIAPLNPKALTRLVDTARSFFGSENIHQFLLTVGWVVAGLHSQEIFKDKKWFPLLNMHGEPGSCKTLAGEAALSLVGSNWAEKGMVSRASVSAIYEHGSKTGSLPFIWDDPPRNPETEEIFKTWANRKARQVRGNRQEPKSPLGSASNHVIGGEQAAAYTRIARLPFERAKGGDNSAFSELQEAQKYASGAFPLLLQIGYPKAEIAALEKELLNHLPKAHARIAQALAIIVCYAQKVVQLVGGAENILQWVIANLCPAEDDTDSAGDSLLDFISKLQALEAIDEVGDWNKKIVTDKNTGQNFVAIYAANAWKMVDTRFKPATYNEKSLKILIDKAGGKTNGVTLKFSADKAQVITYYNALISPRADSDGNPVLPNKPRTTNRKAWLIPFDLWGGSDGDANNDYDDNTGGGGDYSGDDQGDDDNESGAATAATSRYQNPVAAEVLVESRVSGIQPPAATTATTFKQEKEKENSFLLELAEPEAEQNSPPSFLAGAVAAESPSTISVVAATGNLVAAESPSTVQNLANQILLCQTWVAVAEVVNRDGDKLKKAAASAMTREQRQGLTTLLATHLCDNPSDLNQLAWVPVKLRDRALERLSFTIRRIGGAANVLDACWEHFPGCKLDRVDHLGTRKEKWFFLTKEGNRLAVGVDAVQAIAAVQVELIEVQA